ncbi:hypothetical protein KP509_31G049400 [Ceratopteris richardii]|uniref:Uncharacterized protein n=1 Tax=Ceratopteris richardii TaxID=49495 RepID=A0A8T2QXR0_CERRI|nr:hypothetical protein KP509_31G049400 [Ceratopteris richardii]
MSVWELQGCCNHNQVVFIATVGAFIFAILALWRTPLLTPFKLITVFLHEASHAIACILTCGKVEGIKVDANEGGATYTRGGLQWIILPAGYLGSSFWGMILVLASTDLLSARIAAACLVAALIVVLCIAKNVWICKIYLMIPLHPCIVGSLNILFLKVGLNSMNASDNKLNNFCSTLFSFFYYAPYSGFFAAFV